MIVLDSFIMDSNSENAPTVSLSLTVNDTAEALDFYSNAFGAEEIFRMPAPDGSILHAEFMLGNSRICISGESPEWNAYAMPNDAKASCLFAIATDDCDAALAKAVDAGGEMLMPPTDQFWGVRNAMILDPYGYRWTLNHKTEDVSPMEMARRARKLFS